MVLSSRKDVYPLHHGEGDAMNGMLIFYRITSVGHYIKVIFLYMLMELETPAIRRDASLNSMDRAELPSHSKLFKMTSDFRTFFPSLRMEEIFDFTKTYAGAIVKDEQVMPCNLSFPDGKVLFTLVSPETYSFRDYYELMDLYGYISTEKGIKNFRALNAFQIANSSTWSYYSKQQFLANGLIITHEKNNLKQDKFSQVNILFDKLEFTGRFVDVNQNIRKSTSFSIKQYFDKLEFLVKENESLVLENPFSWHHSATSKTIFALRIEPFLSLKPAEPVSVKLLEIEVLRITWFMQLIFEIRQRVTDLILFDTPLKEIPKGRSSYQYFYYRSEMISAKMKKEVEGVIHPPYDIEELADDIKASYPLWNAFDEKERMICRLYFNEINAQAYVADDRFKNLCSIIQGLDIFTGKIKLSGIKGGMNIKLRCAINESLESILSARLDLCFIYRLCELIGDQRDHYQHLNKPLCYDLNNNANEMVAVNNFLSVIVKYHLLNAINFPDDKIRTLITRSISWFEKDLKILEKKLA